MKKKIWTEVLDLCTKVGLAILQTDRQGRSKRKFQEIQILSLSFCLVGNRSEATNKGKEKKVIK
jgi:hypothetical protein